MKNYQHLTIHEREQIRLLLSQGKSLRDIAKDLGRNPRTIGRELERNSPPLGKTSYCPTIAQQQSAARRKESKTKKLAAGALRT